MDRSKNVLGHEISHKDVAAQDLDSRNNSKEAAGAPGGEYDYAALDNDMKQQITSNSDNRADSVENRNASAISGGHKSMKGRPSDVDGAARNSSH
jgi:hypothetical protein